MGLAMKDCSAYHHSSFAVRCPLRACLQLRPEPQKMGYDWNDPCPALLYMNCTSIISAGLGFSSVGAFPCWHGWPRFLTNKQPKAGRRHRRNCDASATIHIDFILFRYINFDPTLLLPPPQELSCKIEFDLTLLLPRAASTRRPKNIINGFQADGAKRQFGCTALPSWCTTITQIWLLGTQIGSEVAPG